MKEKYIIVKRRHIEYINKVSLWLFDSNPNVISFSGYVNNTVIKLPIYFNSHLRIYEQIINIIPK